jgi:hypothetical protein
MWQIEGVLSRAASELEALHEERRVWSVAVAVLRCTEFAHVGLSPCACIFLSSLHFICSRFVTAVCLCAESGCSNSRSNRCFSDEA